ncbi:MAG: hypothetical protein ACYC3I_07005 [Gemmataceae bacterium]
MNFMSRMLSNLILLTALLWTFASFSAEWLVESCVATDRFGKSISLRECLRKNEALSREIQLIVERASAKDKIIKDLLNGKLTLIEAAGWFRSLHDDSWSWQNPRRPRPGSDNGDCWCRLVIDWADCMARFEQSDSRADALRQRLEAELEDQLSRQGGVRLPE